MSFVDSLIGDLDSESTLGVKEKKGLDKKVSVHCPIGFFPSYTTVLQLLVLSLIVVMIMVDSSLNSSLSCVVMAVAVTRCKF